VKRRPKNDGVLGNRSLSTFSYCIVGSGAGGGTAAYVLSQGADVLVLEAGPNPHPGLDDPTPLAPPLHGNDELKYEVRGFIAHNPTLEPRTFRVDESGTGAIHPDVNVLPKLVGGAFVHSDAKTPRFNEVDFRLRSTMDALLAGTPGLVVPGFGGDSASANFADWPFGYADLEPYYVEAEQLYGVQGQDDNPYASFRSRPFPMSPGVAMYLGNLVSEGCRRTNSFPAGPLTPHTYPGAHASRFYGDAPNERPPCVDCGRCSGFGCPNNSKGTPAVVTLRRALLSGRCQLRYNAQAVRLLTEGRRVTGVEYIDGTGQRQVATADRYLLAASPIESARLCFLSGASPTEPIGNSSGQVGRNLMFHTQTNVNGFLPRRIHGDRGRAVTHGLTDFRGVEPGGAAIRVIQVGGAPQVQLGGICEFTASQGLPIVNDGEVYAFQLGVFRRGAGLKNAIRDGALGQHLFGMIMQAEDAPQLTNRVDLDPAVKDVFGRPAPRITYKSHPFELAARCFYAPFMKEILRNAGATQVFLTPIDPLFIGPPSSRHVMGTLRMGADSATSVVDPTGCFHDLDNLYACDGSVFPTSSGYNPTLTIMAVALRIAHGLAGTPPAA